MIWTDKLHAAAIALTALLTALSAGQTLAADQGELRLELDGGNQHWIWDRDVPFADETRPITETRCVADVAALTDLVTLTPTGGPVGFVNSYGVKGPGGRGTPCERVSADRSEAMRLQLSGMLDLMLGINGDMDIETKGGSVIVEIRTFALGTQTGWWILRAGDAADGDGRDPAYPDTDAFDPATNNVPDLVDCNSDTDGGPDSGPNDNCRFLFEAEFDDLQMTPIAGEFSLDGGRDGGSTRPTKFELRDQFEGVCECPEEAGDGNKCHLTAEDPDGRLAVLIRHDNAETQGDCVAIPYNLEWDGLDLSFTANYFVDPQNPQTSALFEWLVIFRPRDVASLRPASEVDVDPTKPNDDFVSTTTAAVFDLRQQFLPTDTEYFLDLCRGIPNYAAGPTPIDRIDLKEELLPVLDQITPITPPAGAGAFSDMSSLAGTQHGCWFQLGAKYLDQDTDSPPDGMVDEDVLLLIVRGFLQGDWSLRFK